MADYGRVAGLEEAVEEWRAAAEEARLAAAVAEARLQDAGRGHAAELEAVGRGHTAELAAMRQQIETEVAARNAVIEELRAMLADARRPWWRRLVGS